MPRPDNLNEEGKTVTMEIVEEGAEVLSEYGQVSIAFTVATRLRAKPVDGGLGGLRLVEEKVEPPWVKDYDAHDGEGPSRWAKRWDLSNWAVLSAFEEERRVGGAVVAWNTNGVNMLEGREDLAVLWDIRVCPERRGQGIGRRLFARAADWTRARGCRQLKVETQDINAPACRFYARQGCVLGGIDCHAYCEYPDEAMLLWYLEL